MLSSPCILSTTSLDRSPNSVAASSTGTILRDCSARKQQQQQQQQQQHMNKGYVQERCMSDHDDIAKLLAASSMGTILRD
jgi:hypothetical protein